MFEFRKIQGISLLAEDLLASQEGLCSLLLVSSAMDDMLSTTVVACKLL